jgi:hypothetical protein
LGKTTVPHPHNKKNTTAAVGRQKKIHRTVNHFLKTVMPFNGGRFAGEKQMRPESFLCGAKFLEKMQGRCGQTNRSERRRTGNGNICPDAFSKFGARTMKPFRCDDAKTR